MVIVALVFAVVLLILGGWFLYNQNQATIAANNPVNQILGLAGL